MNNPTPPPPAPEPPPQPPAGPPAVAETSRQPASMNYALWADRVMAAIIDALFVIIATALFYMAASVVLAAVGAAGGGLANAGAQNAGGAMGIMSGAGCCLLLVLFPVVTFVIGLYNKVFLVGKRGCSIGQGLIKLEVVDKNGGRPSKGTLIVRLLAQIGIGLVPLFGSFLDLLWPLWDPQRQTLHDKAVGTFVIKRG